MPATRPYIPRILLAFDFDRTLARDTLTAAAEAFGLTKDEWERRHVAPLGHGWDDITKRGQALIETADAHGRPLDEALCREIAARVEPFPGVLDMPARLRAVAEDLHAGVELEFVILSSGYAELIAPTPVAAAFDRLLASALDMRGGRARCVKRIIGHPAKALHLEALAKDARVDGANGPEAAAEGLDEHEYHVPFDQMVYVGDGASDLQAFGFLEGRGGLAIAVDKDGALDPSRSQRVENLAPPDYREGAELYESLSLAVRACAARVALRALGRDE